MTYIILKRFSHLPLTFHTPSKKLKLDRFHTSSENLGTQFGAACNTLVDNNNLSMPKIQYVIACHYSNKHE